MTISITEWANLKARDEEIADKVQKNTVCDRCEGPLNRSDFRRKVRGLDFDCSEERRISFCCGKCRKRVTPPSLRYLWRKVYALLSVTMSFENDGFLVSDNKATRRRWGNFWQEQLQQQSIFMSAVVVFLEIGFDFSMESLVTLIRANSITAMSSAFRTAQCLNLLGCKCSLMAHFQTHGMVRDIMHEGL